MAMVHLSDYQIDSRIQRLAGALAQRGDHVDLICIGEREEIRVGAGTIRTHPVRAPKPAGSASAYVRGYARFLAGAMARLTSLDLRRPFDLVEAHNMPDLLTAAALVPRLRGTPVILNVHDTFPELFATIFGRPPDDPLVRLIEREERWGARLADRVITVTDEARRRLESRGVGVGRTVVVMNSPDEHVFGPPQCPRGLPGDGEIRLLYHGGLAPRFGVETLVRAFATIAAHVPRARLRICGTGAEAERRALARLAAELAPGRVEVTPQSVPFGEIPRQIGAAHIGVVPTREDQFTQLLLPVKLLEYVHMGLPVVASRLQGISGYFAESELNMFAPDDPAELSAAVQAVCFDPAAARQRAIRAGRRLRAIAWEHQRARYLSLVDELASARPRAPRSGKPSAGLGGSPSAAT